MRKSKIIKIEGIGEVTVKEISPMSVYKAISSNNEVEEIKTLLFNSVSLTEEQLNEMYASELEQLVDAFMEVNSSFLAIADKLGIRSLVLDLAGKFKTSLPELFAASLQQVTAKLHGTTAGQSS